MANGEFPTEDEKIEAFERRVRINKWIINGALLSIPVLMIILCAVVTSRREPSSPISSVPALPAPTKASTTPAQTIAGEEKADYQGFSYTFKKEGEKSVALFLPRFLPRDDAIVTGAIKDVVRRSFKDDGLSNARLVDWNASGSPTKAIRMDSKTNVYFTVLVKEDTGEVHSLVVTRTSL